MLSQGSLVTIYECLKNSEKVVACFSGLSRDVPTRLRESKFLRPSNYPIFVFLFKLLESGYCITTYGQIYRDFTMLDFYGRIISWDDEEIRISYYGYTYSFKFETFINILTEGSSGD